MKIIVGIPSFNNEDTISFVAQKAAEGIKKYFDGDGIIINSDGGSSDKTREVFLKTDTFGIPKESFIYEGVPGKGSAMKSIMEKAKFYDAEYVVFLDSDLRSVKDWWIERLTKPMVEGKASYVTPFYIRHKYDGTITNHICYPITSSFYGKKVRQPIGGDFGVSREMIDIYLSKPSEIWKGNVAKFGIDIWMTTTALNESKKGVWQAALGTKIHDVKDPGKHLGPMFLQVVQTLFDLTILYQEQWIKVKDYEDVEIYGDMPEEEPEEIKIDLENMKNKASKGVFERKNQYDFLNKKIIDYVIHNAELDAQKWAEIVYDTLLEYKEFKNEKLVENLIPFYFARVAKFVEDTINMDTKEAETLINEQIEVFKDMKLSYLIKRW